MENPFGLTPINEEEECTEYGVSSLVSSKFVSIEYKTPDMRKRDIHEDYCTSLATISNLYMYTNPPPMGYGNPGPKVAESVLRSQSFNLKEAGTKEKMINGFVVNAGYWEDPDKDFPSGEVTGNWHPGEAYQMLTSFRNRNSGAILACGEQTLDYFIRSNANILTSGRQTWCPLSQTSCPSPDAYINFIDYLKMNNEEDNHSLFTFTQIIHKKRTNLVKFIFLRKES